MLPLILAPLLVLSQPESSPPEMLQDAELTAVTFADADRGWAVGDRGVIWHTDDGGRNWKLQRSGVTCRLEAIQFLDADNGWAVGGWTQPYTHRTHGVILRTRDGGRTWQETLGLALPSLRQLKMIDSRHGWAIGDSSPQFPSGVFQTIDGGRSWSPIAKGESLGWVAGDFRDAQSGAVAGLGGTIAAVTATEVKPAPPAGPRFLRRLLFNGQSGGWLAGDGGLLLQTGDGGCSWNPPADALPAAVRGLDFRALAVRGSRVWLAGAPGTLVAHSPDNGQTWFAFRTDNTVPLLGLWFSDAQRGWAVGSLGTILHTRDGGQTWRMQRSGGTRAALLGVFGAAERLPLELIASQAGSEAYLTAVEIIGRRDTHPFASDSELTEVRRTHEATVAAGGSGADISWRFPLADAGLPQSTDSILARWRAFAGEGEAERLEEHLVRRIRQWRPDVLVTEDVSPRGDDPLAHLTNQVTLSAAEIAASDTAYPEHLAQLGLKSWRVKKVFAVLAADKPGVVNLAPGQWSQPLGCSIAEQAGRGRALLVCDVIRSPRTVGLSLLVNHLPQGSGRTDVLGGISLQFGSDARRLQSQSPAGDAKALAQNAQKRHLVDQLLARIGDEQTLGAGWLGQVGDLTQGLSNRQCGEIVWQMARQYQTCGKNEQAAEALHYLLDKHPQHPLSDAAASWLVQYYASSEVAWRERSQTKRDVQQASASAGVAAFPATSTATAAFTRSEPSNAAGNEPTPKERPGRALALGKQIEQLRPHLFAEPAVKFSLATASRQAGQPRWAERTFQLLAGRKEATRELTASTAACLWTQNAAAEQWLNHSNQQPPKPVCSAVTAAEKPRLDGRLDDPLWKAAKPVSLKAGDFDDSALPAAAVMAFDAEFLYIAVSCRKAPLVDYTVDRSAAELGRTADADFTARDHVAVRVDLDRDYGSFWTLAFDDRGWPAESCFGDSTWNPQWYIAAGGDEQFWTIEAAIPLTELTGKAPQVRDVWAIGIQRVVPGVGVQSFTSPARYDPCPEAFGLLVFE